MIQFRIPHPSSSLCLLFGAGLLLPGATMAQGLDPDDFSCRASALRAEGPLATEPFVANKGAVPCREDDAALLGAVTVLDIHARALAAATSFTDPGIEDATLAQGIALTGEVDIGDLVSAEVLVAEARVDSAGGSCELQGFSFVGAARVLGRPIRIVDGPMEVPIPGVGILHLNASIVEPDRITRRALWLESHQDLFGDVVVAEATAGTEDELACARGAEVPEGRLWMTGGGRVDARGVRVTHGFRLECDPEQGPNRLQINWSNGNSFHLEALEEARCTDDPGIDPAPPAAAFDTFEGMGVGRLNGEAGATADWIFTDAGQPGHDDRARILIRDGAGHVVLDVDGPLSRGNHQAHGR
jgi:hypothetical protein